jgi:hypothetical protein
LRTIDPQAFDAPHPQPQPQTGRMSYETSKASSKTY